MVLSIAQSCEVFGRIVCVVGLDLSVSEIVENVTYFNTYGNSYAFFINKEGTVFFHSSELFCAIFNMLYLALYLSLYFRIHFDAPITIKTNFCI